MASELPVALITGTNSGLGLSIAVKMSKTHRVYAGMRSISKGEKLQETLKESGEPSNVVVTEIDVNSDESVTKAFEKMLEETKGRLDVLVCNAGYSVMGSVEFLSLERCQEQFNTNFFGVIRCQKAALPAMRAQKSGKIIAISSVGGVWGQPFCDVYCASKFAVEGLFESQVALFRTFGIRLSSVQPGGIQTSFGANVARPDPSGIPAEYMPGLQSTMAAYMSGSLGSQTPEEIADIIDAKIIQVAEPPLKVQVNTQIDHVFQTQLADVTGEAGVKMAKERFLKDL